jgi:dienelactone hydrolase
MTRRPLSIGTAWVILTVAAGAGVGAIQEPHGEENPLGVTVQNEDYAVARMRFRTTLLTKGPAPWNVPQDLTVPAGVEVAIFKSGELRLKGWLAQPAAAKQEKHPAVLFLHGGFSFDMSDWEMSRPYRDAGYVVFAPMLRGENGQAGNFTLFYDEVDDVVAAGKYLKGLPYLDKDRVFVAGHSVGGTMALLAAMACREFRASAAFDASPDQVVFCRYDRNIPIPFDRNSVEEATIRSPLAYAASLKCPTRIYWGSKTHAFERTTPRIAEIARDRGLDVEAVRVEGDHGSMAEPAIAKSIEFFRSVTRK